MPKMIGRMAPPKAAKPAAVKPAAAKPSFSMDPKSVLGRAERVQRMEAGESRMARSMPAKKPATPTMSPAAAAATRATLARAERIQREEAGERMLMKRKPVEVIRTTVRMKETPAKKK